MTLKVNIPECVLALKKELEEGFNCRIVIAGGCIRDLAHGISPKDYDFFPLSNMKIYPPILDGTINLNRELNDGILDEIYEKKDTIKNGHLSLFYPEYAVDKNQETDDRFSGVVKFKSSGGYEVDVIKLCVGDSGEMPETTLDVLNVFDMTLNQFAVDRDSCIITLFDGVNVKPVREDFTQARFEYIKGKFPQYDYSQVEALFN